MLVNSLFHYILVYASLLCAYVACLPTKLDPSSCSPKKHKLVSRVKRSSFDMVKFTNDKDSHGHTINDELEDAYRGIEYGRGGVEKDIIQHEFVRHTHPHHGVQREVYFGITGISEHGGLSPRALPTPKVEIHIIQRNTHHHHHHHSSSSGSESYGSDDSESYGSSGSDSDSSDSNSVTFEEPHHERGRAHRGLDDINKIDESKLRGLDVNKKRNYVQQVGYATRAPPNGQAVPPQNPWQQGSPQGKKF